MVRQVNEVGVVDKFNDANNDEEDDEINGIDKCQRDH